MSDSAKFMPLYYEAIEDSLKPLFEYILKPDEIEFEEEIVLIIKSFIKKA